MSSKRIMSPVSYENAVSPKKLKLLDQKQVSSIDEFSDNFDFLMDDDFNLDEIDAAEKKATKESLKLDLSKWQRCCVESVEREKRSHSLILKVSSAPQSGKENHNEDTEATCYLQGPWLFTNVNEGDIVSLIGVWDDSLKAFKVDKDDGYCVTSPDVLISGTTVVGSLFCRRKAVLQDRFRGIDANSKVMIIGSLVHELLQIVLQKEVKDARNIEKVAKELLHSQETASMLYSSMLTLEETQQEIWKFVPFITDFVKRYVEGKEPTMIDAQDFQGTITKIQDIEENLWVPQMGLKGKIDVSVQIKRHKNALKFESQPALPLELKTGRASFSMEHKGQLILYQMMLTALGYPTNSGFLLYLREGKLREIKGSRNERRDLIVLRNEVAHHLGSLPELPPANVPLRQEDDKFWQPFDLPEPISHPTACSQCAYNTLCCSFAKTDAHLQLRESHPLNKIAHETTSHLTAKDYEYFIKWCSLLSLEEQEAKKSNNLRFLWTSKPEERQQQGRAICNLKLCKKSDHEDSRFINHFEVQTNDDEEFDMTLSGFDVGEYTIVSTAKRTAVAAGWIHELTKSHISISLERDLHQNYSSEEFVIDKNDSHSSNVFNFTNLSLLLDQTEKAEVLRSIIIQKEQPSFAKVLPKVIATEGVEIMKNLNSVQKAAVLKALTTESFMLIKGLPGTGKTQTLVAIVRLLHLMGKSVIITSHTHSAVDNLMLRLKDYKMKMIRLGSAARTNPLLKDCSEAELIRDCTSEQALRKCYASFKIVGVTCLGSAHSIFLHQKFDYCIVDEATQVMQPTVLRPLLFCEKFILVGDPDQLPPLIKSREARQRGADESLFQLLDSEQATSVLTLQYRMNKTITKLANALTYDGALKCASNDVQNANMKLNTNNVELDKWLARVLQPHVDQAVFVVDTLDCAERSQDFASHKHSQTCSALEMKFGEEPMANLELSPSKIKQTKRLSKYTNYCEAALVFQILKALLKAGFQAERIGVIAPYRAQVELLKKLSLQYHKLFINRKEKLPFEEVEVNTVDQYQGRDKDIILYSCSKTGAGNSKDLERSREAEILEDKRRLNVAITRSKHKLIMIGDVNCLQQYTPFATLLGKIPSFCKMKMEEGKLGFEWQPLLNELNEAIAS